MSATQLQTDAYQRAIESSAFRVLPQAGCVRLGGETRLDYLQRQTSNDMQRLNATQALPNALTAATGKVLEVFTVLDEGEAYALLTPPGRGPALAAYFQRRIFFNDQVQVEDHSEAWAQLEVHGPQAAAALAALGLERAPGLDQVNEFDWQGHPIRAIGIVSLTAPVGCLLLIPSTQVAALSSVLASVALPLEAALAEALRIEAGQPGPDELAGAYTPFELGLAARVSDTKGCYTGQEVLARQVTYDKVTRQLAVLACEALAEPGASVVADGKTVGLLTSVAHSPRLGALGMAVLRKPFHESGTKVAIQAEDASIAATIR